MEQLNIVGKRSGDGFVAHKAKLVNALSRGLAERLLLMDFNIGRKGFLNFVKALTGSNVVKIVPAASNGGASETQTAAKRLKVVCGATTSFLNDMAWIGDKTPITLAEVRISPANIIKPNIGSLELAEALNRVLPFTSGDSAQGIKQCVLFGAKEGKLSLVATDGYRLAIATLDYEGEGEVLVNRDELKGIATAIGKAKRLRLGMERNGDSLEGMSLIIDTEATRYSWHGAEGQFPDYQKVIPTEFNTVAHLDSIEAVKVVYSFRALSDNPKDYPVDLTIGDGKIVMANPDEKGEAIIPADTEGQCSVRIDGGYFAQALKSCGGMVDFQLTNAYSPMLFANDGYQVVLMPLITEKAQEAMKQERGAKQAKASAEEPAEEPAKEPIKPEKRSRKRNKNLVAVA